VIDFLENLQRTGERFIDVIARSDRDALVPCCPGWLLRDLALHQGHVWEWARHCIEAGTHVDQSEESVIDERLPAWLRDQLDALVGLLRATDPEAPTWTFGPKPRLAAFWFRRQAHEVTVHLWDAESAVGTPHPISAELAADGVDEVFTVFLPRQVRLERMAAVDEGVRIRLPDGRTYDIGDRASAEVTGDPSDLLLALWHRLPLDVLTISGDVNAARTAFDRALTP
jgi:uncharacterized protein (TIGR03083 family)